MHKYLMAPVVKAVVAGVDGSYLIGGSAKVPMIDMSVSPAVLVGSSVGTASTISSLSHDLVFDMRTWKLDSSPQH